MTTLWQSLLVIWRGWVMLICLNQNKETSEQNMASENQQQKLREKARQTPQRSTTLQNKDSILFTPPPGEK